MDQLFMNLKTKMTRPIMGLYTCILPFFSLKKLGAGLPAGGMRASQCTFSSVLNEITMLCANEQIIEMLDRNSNVRI